ncbi:MAG: TetR/AcrR family transcriptional regulator [Candidatus Cloacimonetes bacterium]|nr:TetR/AcrR family transcriptional regulator [Candidatus Cloacimonadota bacterium]MCF7814299.1 TetR/AcrR family transcriptional regulator [Candidatus Cloacimonadota bacterium]MCF7868376.1 TetR/AcrR family transcriptional regulator [Candidatus Cloacimonadota bacterium]MCF7883858.1 TetR/AcrR family transcriptional regulator [Candidatus Cloacimonadota bacterium]
MARREEILEAAQHAFLKYGIEKITLDDIAHECGIQKTALYYYFKNKEELLAEMILLKINEIQDRIKKAVDAAGSVKEKLRTYMSTKINIMRENMQFLQLFDKEGLPMRAQKFLEENKQKLMQTDFCLVKDIIKQGIKNQKVSYELKDSLVLMILGVTYGTFVGRYLEDANWDVDEMIETSIEVIFKGIE